MVTYTIYLLNNSYLMENIIVAISNLPSLYPIYISYMNEDYTTCASMAFVAGASFISHLIENHKHGMPGIGFSITTSRVANKFDVLGCYGVISRFAYLYYKKYGFDFNVVKKHYPLSCYAILCFICLYISERDKYNPALKKRYIGAHITWHMGIFTVMGKFLSNLIYC